MAHEINFEISLVIFMPNITTNHAVTYTNNNNKIIIIIIIMIIYTYLALFS